jgi:uncharacterized protein
VNRLAAETSPYLLQHADNPVDWYPWGEEAFERARTEDKPVLLSVGYAACHWCHVMEHESFEDPETAALMNERFVCVKVDREERPDVDGLYMDAVVTMTGQGGWPMTVFLTPDGRPFFGGTYFPPEPRYSMPSFSQLLLAVDQAYRERRQELERQADALVGAIREASAALPSNEPLTSELLALGVSALAAQFDREHGGFGRAPKFPPASNLELLLRSGRDDALDMVRKTLDGMAAGGMYDLVGGGFHRYSVDEAWLVPHFEKMLYDNALLASVYLHGWLVLGEERYGAIAEETLDYMVRELRLPKGGFASAQDADTAGEEGLTYTWTEEEVADKELLRPFEGRFILRGELPADERERLLEEASHRLERPDYLEIALELAKFLLGPMTGEDGRLFRTYRDGTAKIDGYLEDYADVTHGLIELHWATGDLRWLEQARSLVARAERFRDADRGGYFVDDHGLVARRKEFDDHPTPSGNSMMAYVLLRLGRLYGDAELEKAAVEIFRVARPLVERAPTAAGHLLCALDLHFSAPREVAVVGASEELRRAALDGFQPNTVFAFSDGPTDAVPLLAGKPLVDGRPAAYVCERFACQAPETSPEALRAALDVTAPR